MRVLSVDLETYSATSLDTGVYRYADDPDFEILLIGYSFDGGPVTVHDCTQPGCWPRDLLDALTDPDVLKTAYNAAFERNCFAAALEEEMPPEQWDDTMIRAAELGLPGSLGAVGAALGLPEDKQKDAAGKRLIKYFCEPCKPTKANGGRTRNRPTDDPEKWAQFIEYNRQDVVAEMAIRTKLLKYAMPQSEWDLWCIDQRINDRGIRIDRTLVRNVIREADQYTEELMAEAREITGLENPNSVSQLKSYLESFSGPIVSLNKDALPEIASKIHDEKALRVLRIRQELGKTSVKKYQAMRDAVCTDDRIRGLFRFYGANRTGRWAGRIVQPQNLARNSLEDLDLARQMARDGDTESLQLFFGGLNSVFSELIRTAFIPSPGCRFVVSDFSAIEARVIAWLAGESWRMRVFRDGGDIYCASASQMFHVPVVKHGVNGELRQKGKIAELALGYGGGVGAMKAMDKAGSIPEEELPGIVEKWREASPSICKLWKRVEKAAATAVEEQRTVTLPRKVYDPERARENEALMGRPRNSFSDYFKEEGGELQFSYKDKILFVELPSGRRLAYQGIEYKPNVRGMDALTYLGTDQNTKQWVRIDTWGGKIVENIVQAIARDCLAETMRAVEAAGYKIVMHVHDEIIVDVPNGDKQALETISGIMARPIKWAPGLLLRGDGYETNYYKKD